MSALTPKIYFLLMGATLMMILMGLCLAIFVPVAD